MSTIKEVESQLRKVKKEVVQIYPQIFEDVDCRGSQWGFCPEPRKRSCGKYPQR